MDESLQELENELKRLTPRTPSTELLSHLALDLDAPEPQSETTSVAPVVSLWRWLNWRTSAAAAALVAFTTILVVTRQTPPGNPADQSIATATPPATSEVAVTPGSAVVTLPLVATDRYHPVGAASVLYDLREDGRVNLANHAPARRLRYRYVDTYTWKNPATNASLKWSVPRDEVRVIPASLH